MNKIDDSISLIRKYAPLAEKYGGYSVMFSGGKDSQVMLDIFQRSGVPFRAYYSVTTNDPPENVYFIRDNYPEVEFVHPKRTFLQLIGDKKMLPTFTRRFCCSELKENHGKGVVAVGVRREESAKRASYDTISFRSNRPQSRIFSEDKMRESRTAILRPIIEWREDEIWQYIEEEHLPVNPCYEVSGRVGCMFCPFASSKLRTFYASKYPKYYANLMKVIKKLKDEGYYGKFRDEDEVWEWWISNDTQQVYHAKKRQLKLDI